MSAPYNNAYNSNDNGSKGWALGFGLLAGVAIGYYLNSNEGRAARRKAQVRFDEYGNQINEKYGEFAEQARVKGQEYANTAKQQLASTREWATTTAEQVKATVTEQAQALKTNANTTAQNLKANASSTVENLKGGASSSANSVADSFKRGMDKAKGNIDAKSEKIEQIVEDGKSKQTPTPAANDFKS